MPRPSRRRAGRDYNRGSIPANHRLRESRFLLTALDRIPIRSHPLDAVDLLHDRLATSVLLFMVAVGLWGIVGFFRGGSLSGSLAGAFAIGQGLIAVQVLAGVALVLLGRRPPSSVHYLYGATAILVLPFAWSYLRSRNPRLALLYYSLGSLFIAGLAIRGMTTGR